MGSHRPALTIPRSCPQTMRTPWLHGQVRCQLSASIKLRGLTTAGCSPTSSTTSTNMNTAQLEGVHYPRVATQGARDCPTSTCSWAANIVRRMDSVRSPARIRKTRTSSATFTRAGVAQGLRHRLPHADESFHRSAAGRSGGGKAVSVEIINENTVSYPKVAGLAGWTRLPNRQRDNSAIALEHWHRGTLYEMNPR